ncbi:iron-containing alcohol dehydrogenase family protein [Clostridium sediminicola]|uniref:iron-containing alcohol dehydrogenase family protein n=1 Tax=Clostridium sediminicola TaxID=3114879 RepID=UPI0031F26E38
MEQFRYYMPTEVFYGKDILKEKIDLLKVFGKKAFIITGKSSSKKNGSLDEIKKLMNEIGCKYLVFNEVEENPSIDTVKKAGEIGRKENVDFIIGVGGGSPIDAAKGIGVYINNNNFQVEDLFNGPRLESIPIIAIPTTAGTGTEVTPFAIFTDHRTKTKRNFFHKVFPRYAFLDAKYLETCPDEVTVNTSIDALSHLMEGYLNVNANIISDSSAEKGFRLFSECKEELLERKYSFEIREKLLLMSTLGGLVIAQCGTSLPHGMGYHLTYFHGVPHGKANGLVLEGYLKLCNETNKEKVKMFLLLTGFESVKEFGEYLIKLFGTEFKLGEEDIIKYAEAMSKNEMKLKNHPGKVDFEVLKNIYEVNLK